MITLASEREKLYREHAVLILLNRLLSGAAGSGEIRPVLDPVFGYRYPEVERDIEGTSADALALLERLEKARILEKKFFDKIVLCPSCKVSKVTFHYLCPVCGSLHIHKKGLIEHISCGHIDAEEKFKKDGKLICPRCDLELKELGVDYRIPGSWFECASCHKRFDEPVFVHDCGNCGSRFTVRDAILTDIYSYILNKEAEAEVRRGIILLTPIAEALRKAGFSVESPGFVQGTSGATHQFDIVASKTVGGTKSFIGIGVASSTIEVDEQPVISLFAKIFDTHPAQAILVVIPKLGETGRRMADLYKIKVVEAANVEEAVKKLRALVG